MLIDWLGISFFSFSCGHFFSPFNIQIIIGNNFYYTRKLLNLSDNLP